MASELVLALKKKGMIAKVQSRVNWEATVNRLKQSDMCKFLLSQILTFIWCCSVHRCIRDENVRENAIYHSGAGANGGNRVFCSNLSEQHRWSLLILLSRCDMTKCAQRVFQCSIEREIEILVFLHKVAIASASQIKFGCEGGDAMTALAEAMSHGIAKLPRLLI